MRDTKESLHPCLMEYNYRYMALQVQEYLSVGTKIAEDCFDVCGDNAADNDGDQMILVILYVMDAEMTTSTMQGFIFYL